MILILFLGMLFSACSETPSSPNIIFIMTDDHSTAAISSYGSRINQTPNIDRLAREGMRFDNCFCTNAICAPSRAVILTGKFSHMNGVIDNKLAFDGSQQTLPKILQQAGYQTAMIGKWHLKSDPTGFDYWNILPGQGFYYNPDFIEMGEKKQITGYVTDLITDFSLDWLEKRDRSKPFLLMYQHKAPHRSWMPGLDHLYTYYNDIIPEPPTLFDDYATRSAAARESEMTIAGHMFPAFDLKLPISDEDTVGAAFWLNRYNRFTPEQRELWDNAYLPQNQQFKDNNPQGNERIRYYYQRYIKDYLRCVASVDDNLGRLLSYLDDNGLTDNTIVVYTSDQGFFLGEHGWFDKRFMYEEALRMPLIIRYPGHTTPGSVNKAIVQNSDFAPTLLELAGLQPPYEMQGRSFSRLLTGSGDQEFHRAAYYHYYEYPGWHMVKKHYGIRTDRYKLIHFYDDIDAWELYDLARDPHEMTNILSNPDYSAVLADLHGQLSELAELYQDTLAISLNKKFPR